MHGSPWPLRARTRRLVAGVLSQCNLSHAHDESPQGRRLSHACRAPVLLDLLNLGAGAKMDIGVEGDRLIVVPRTRPAYTLDELLAMCDETAPADHEDRACLDGQPVGNELL